MRKMYVHKRISYRAWTLEVTKMCGWTKEEDILKHKRLLIIQNAIMASVWLKMYRRSYFASYMYALNINRKKINP